MKAFNVRTETQQMFICILFLLSIGQVTGIQIQEISVPKTALEGDQVHLRCNYSEENGSTLYTLKWYKDGQEFYRHQPGISPHTTEKCRDFPVYHVEGVNVDCWISSERDVVLRDTNKYTTGIYMCEAIGEHPNFRKASRHSNLTVYSEPLNPPVIVGGEELYELSAFVSLNCSSANSEYVPRLSWYINGRQAPERFVSVYNNNQTLGLHFETRVDHFQRGVITVSCVSAIGLNHKKSTQKQLRSSNYLTAQEYQFNTGVVQTPSWQLQGMLTFFVVFSVLGIFTLSV